MEQELLRFYNESTLKVRWNYCITIFKILEEAPVKQIEDQKVGDIIAVNSDHEVATGHDT